MKKILLFLMFLILSLTSLAERFVVSSKDGYANLREEASIKSKVIKKVNNSYTIFNPIPEDNNRYRDWYFVEIESKSKEEAATGYIHKSQLGKHQEIYVTSSKDGHINVRAKPNTSLQILVTLDSGMYVRRYPEKTVGDWYYVNYGLEGAIAPITTEGYIHKSQLKKVKQ